MELPGSRDSKMGDQAFPGSPHANAAIEKISHENIIESKETLRRRTVRVDEITAHIAAFKLEGRDTTSEEHMLVQMEFAAKAAANAVNDAEDICALADLNPDEDHSEVLLVIGIGEKVTMPQLEQT